MNSKDKIDIYNSIMHPGAEQLNKALKKELQNPSFQGLCRFMPVEPTNAMIKILIDGNPPYTARPALAGLKYEVIKLTEIGFKPVSRHRTFFAAMDRARIENAKWRYAQLIKLGG